MIPKRYEDVDYDKDVPESVKRVYETVRSNRKGIYIHGGVGTGKTHIAYAILKKWGEDRDKDLEVIEKYKDKFEYDPYKEVNGSMSYIRDEEKDRLLAEALKENPCRPEARLYNTTKMLNSVRNDYQDKTGFQAMVIESTKFIILDDIGSEKATEFVEEFFYLMINTRYEKVVPMIFTSNLPLSALAEKIGDRTVSRIKEMCNIIEIGGEDKRLTK